MACEEKIESMKSEGRVIWITGLSGAGKTTLAKAVSEKLSHSILLDGDNMREVLGCQTSGFDAMGRLNLALTYSRLANMLARQGFVVVVATISLFHRVHAWNRANMPGYLEVFLDVPAEVRRSRDPKGLYAGEKKGKVTNMAGNTVAVEFPLNPDLRLDENYSLEASVAAVLKRSEQVDQTRQKTSPFMTGF